jgi:hypothetical protein
MQWSNLLASRPPVPSTRTPGFRLTVVTVISGMTISGDLLFMLHIPYGHQNSPIYAKFHPSVLLAAVALYQFVRQRGISRPGLSDQGARFFVISATALALSLAPYLVFQGLSGTATAISTFFPALASSLIVQNSSERERKILITTVVIMALFNAAICILENIFEYQLIPPYYGDVLEQPAPGEFRGYALYDHPLDGAMMTMIGMFAIFASQKSVLWTRLGFILLLCGLVAFGGRTALVSTAVILTGYGLKYLLRELRAGQVTVQKLFNIMATAIVIPATVVSIFLFTGIGQRISHRFYFDDSSQARAVEFQLLPMLSTHDWIFGMSFDRLSILMWQIGLDVPFSDVENFLLAELLELGAIGFALWLVGFLAAVIWGYRRANPWGKVMLISVLLVASTSNSIARKSNLLNVLLPTVMCTAVARRTEPMTAAVAISPTSRVGWKTPVPANNWQLRSPGNR